MSNPMEYDDWNEPDDWDDNPYIDECYHENATVDVLTGELLCHCGYHRYLSGEEIKREAQIQAEMMEAYYLESQEDEPASLWITDRWAIPTVLGLCVVAGVMLGIGGVVADVVGLALFGAATQVRPRS